MKYMMVIAYDGSKFHGFQRQKNLRNVQGELEKALTNVLQEEILIKGAGRTDAFVHAKGQVVHFETKKNVTNLKKKLNNILNDIKVKKIKKVNDDFHARHSAISKTYLYKIDLSGQKDSRYYNVIKNDLNLKEMKKAASIFLGTHDFRNFVAGSRDDYHSTITSIKIYKIHHVIYMKFTGFAFYRYMVRNLVGALIEVGKGKVNVNLLNEMLKCETDKRLPTASPTGLYLLKIRY